MQARKPWEPVITSPTEPDAEELGRILDRGLLSTVYQPIVELETGRTVAYEALARGPAGSPLHEPERMFAAARRAGRVVELDWACRASALRGAQDSALRPPRALFVNIEPDVAGVPAPPELRQLLDWARAELHLVVELTERSLTARPAGVLAGVPFLRGAGIAIALDDVGADARSLALMPFVHPEVVKLDARLVQESPDREFAATVHAVAAAKAVGTRVLAEGIETEEHLERARALGARFGQGWLFGMPGAAPADAAPVNGDGATRFAKPRTEAPPAAAAPFDLVADRADVREADAGLVAALAHELEDHVRNAGPTGVLLVATPAPPAPERWSRYRALAERAAFVGVVGAELGDVDAGVRSGTVRAGDPVAGEWTVCVVSPHLAAAMTARRLAPDGGGPARYRYCLTYDRDVVCAAARLLMARVAPAAS